MWPPFCRMRLLLYLVHLTRPSTELVRGLHIMLGLGQVPAPLRLTRFRPVRKAGHCVTLASKIPSREYHLDL